VVVVDVDGRQLLRGVLYFEEGVRESLRQEKEDEQWSAQLLTERRHWWRSDEG
jgi:hypothetical protein